MGPMATGVSPGKIPINVYYYMQYKCICKHTYVHTYVCIIYRDFSESVNWHLAVLHMYIHTYLCTYIYKCSTCVCTVLLSLSRSVYTNVCTCVCTYFI